jgi:hypothetical protein
LDEAVREDGSVIDALFSRGVRASYTTYPLPARKGQGCDPVKEINSLIDATNSIVRDLAKEGIHLPT